MFDPIDFDPALAALWPVGGGVARLGEPDAALTEAAGALLLETKAAAAPAPQPAAQAEELQRLLNDMTAEMRSQFEVFRAIRADAEARLATGDEAEAKLAKADLKSANDALSLIVRTIEKIDSLQRSLAHDREMAAEQEFDQADYEAMLADIDRKISDRAEERLRLWLADRGYAEDGSTGPPAVEARKGHTEPEAAAGGEGLAAR